MVEHTTDPTPPDAHPPTRGSGIPAAVLAGLAVAGLAIPGIGTRYYVHGDVHVIHFVLSLFFSVNLLICAWEACLFLRRDHIEKRAAYWRTRKVATGRVPAREFLSTRVPFGRILSPTVWADVWATYAVVDPSFSDRRSFGFNVDVVNGFVTPVPTLILYAACTVEFMPAAVAGILGTMLFWQWTYGTSAYYVSFFVAGRQRHITRGELYANIGALNAPWVLCPMLGLYVSIRLILDGDYSVLGF